MQVRLSTALGYDLMTTAAALEHGELRASRDTQGGGRASRDTQGYTGRRRDVQRATQKVPVAGQIGG